MATRPQLLLTNDDGIDSVGLHVLARAMRELGDVTIIAPDSEYSGAGAAIGAIWETKPEAHEARVDGIDKAWSVSGPPALCVMFARMGAFDFTPDLIISGINPGANVGRSVYHSGTIGACLTGRNGGISGIAVSQRADIFGVEGQAWEDTVKNQKWQSAADVAVAAAAAVLENPPEAASVLNINVPNLATDDLSKWRWTEVGNRPPRTWTKAWLEPKAGHVGSYHVELEYGDSIDQPAGTDTRAIMENEVSMTWLSRLEAQNDDTTAVDARLQQLIGS